MGAQANIGGGVSEVIEADLRSWVAKHGIVLWLDADAHYTALVDRLAVARQQGALPYDVVGFRGSYLEVLRKLENLTGGVVKKPVVVHLPGFGEADVHQGPLLELYLAGVRYRKALDTAVTEAAAGRVRPDAIDAFKVHPVMTLAAADGWLAGQLADGDGGFGAALRHLSLQAIVDDLLAAGSVTQEMMRSRTQVLVWEHLAVAAGIPDEWGHDVLPQARDPDYAATGKEVAFVLTSWALAVEYVDDLRRPPIASRLAAAKALPRALVDRCRELVQHLRARHPEFYQWSADATEELLADERAYAVAKDLGKIDTFRFEEHKVLQDALRALAQDEWDTAADWARVRLDGGSFWLRDPARDAAWQLLRDAAALGRAVVDAGPKLGAKDLSAALARYTRVGAQVDRAHRQLEQRRVALLYPLLPEFDSLRAALDHMREVWRAWADAWAVEFNTLCRQSGFLPEPSLRQRDLFDDVVLPLCKEPGTTAYFVIDAFRYEMGEELLVALAGTPATQPQLHARLAELPTVTEVGMNVLAPVSRQGHLRPAITEARIRGFSAGEFRVHDPETRQRAKRERVGGATCPWLSLEDVVNRDNTTLKKTIAQAKLVVVHSEEIDKAGEKGVGPSVFDHVLQKLRAAWRLLRDAGVRKFVFTADHGFLLLDERTKPAQSHGRKIDPKRRHTISTVPADHDDEARVALADLGYDGVDGQHLMFPASTALFDTGKRVMSFAHGGNSLQERVIPVLVVVHRAAAGSTTLSYSVTAKPEPPVADMQCFSGQVEISKQTTLDFAGAKEVELALRLPDGEDATVELCQTRGDARMERASFVAAVGRSFEVFFRLRGPAEQRVRVEVFHPSAQVELAQCVLEGRYDVMPAPSVVATPAPASVVRPAAHAWLEAIADERARKVFAHIAEHGLATEDQVAALLGSPRAARSFTLRFEDYAKLAPFVVRIQSVGGVKRYVREGGEP
jgi:hypothetical protein